MYTKSTRSARSTAHVIYRAMIAVAACGCADPAPADPVAHGDASAVSVPPAGSVADASALAADAAVSPPTGHGTDAGSATPRESVDANGLRGALVDLPFLAEMGEGKKSLVVVDWEIPPNSEFYLCGRVTVPEDVYFNEVQPLNPLGTHHTAVGLLDRPNRPDGVTLCDLSEIGRRGIDASGVGTAASKMPPGIAMKAERGTQLLLNLHVFNTTDAPLRGRSGTLVAVVAPAEVTTLADAVIAGPTKLDIPPGQSVQTGVCTVEFDYEIFGVFPHMHQLGRHMRVVAKRAAGEPVVLYEGAYDFAHQPAHRIDPPLALAAGDRIEIACTYDNATGEEVHFGEGSRDEMCLVRLARFPGGERSACPF